MTLPRREEKRQHPRRSLRLPVRIGTEGKMYEGTALDISEGGLRVATSGSFPLGSMVELYVQFPAGVSHLRARVVREGHGDATVGLALPQGGKALVRACERLAEELGPAAEEKAPPAEPAGRAPGPPPPPGPVRRLLETAQGNNFEILIDPEGSAWRLTVFPSPRNPNTLTPLLEERHDDYPSLDRSLRLFLKGH